MKTINTSDLSQLLNNGLPRHIELIDVREPFECAQGIIAGTRCISLSLLPLHIDSLSREKEYILICRSGNRSGQAGYFLEKQGFTHVTNYEDGMLGWLERELPTVLP